MFPLFVSLHGTRVGPAEGTDAEVPLMIQAFRVVVHTCFDCSTSCLKPDPLFSLMPDKEAENGGRRWIHTVCLCVCVFRQQRGYIATQGPLAETTEDFWRMLWEHNSTIVVMLTILREMGRV